MNQNENIILELKKQIEQLKLEIKDKEAALMNIVSEYTDIEE